ncbi:transcriptional regulator, Spx/MgsR family [Sphingomonas gellani]|uniref:Transcriptional regulator, Spx/MgsR family n=1 Tax=Sphingomonas gellani TaxID=1166340 RepID=A0A1H7ZHZ9_9SPHN|nr:arsenate reductase [Sphingomonas gellani]SEM58040.1 transcriptional regulator, Spx/MgsR family [Sphingomonas gellani]
MTNATLFGIPNCDTVKKARTWLGSHDVDYAFHDYKKAGVDPATLREWVERVGWEALLNRSGTIFRKLPDDAKHDLDAERAIAIMIAHPSAIRRPVLVLDNEIVVGWSPERYAQLFG